MDEAFLRMGREALLDHLNLETDGPIVGLFPGSRQHEIKYHLDTILKAASIIAAKIPSAKFLLPLAPFLPEETVKEEVKRSGLPITLTAQRIYDVANACDSVITAAGTATLQTALMGTPMVILYRMSPVSHAIARRLVRLSHIGLANIVAGEGVVREFIQDAATPENIAGEVLRILEDDQYRQRIKQGLAGVRDKMGQPGCSERVARIASEMSKK
jgi:lipid-A-disaccharide synthase